MRRIISGILCFAICLCLKAGALASGEASGEASGAYVASGKTSGGALYGYAGGALEPAGPVTVSGDAIVENKAVISVGAPAVQDAGTSSIVVRDSVIVGVDPDPTAPLAGNPGNLLVAGNVRTTLALGQSHAYYVNSTIISSNWAALSTDGAKPALSEEESELSLYAYGTLARTTEGGYGAYSDLFCNLYLYGSDIEAAEIGIISGTYGTVTVGSIADGEADAAMAARLTDADMDAREDKSLGSVVSGGRNALMIHSVNLPPYWAYEGYSQEELPLYSTPVEVKNSILRTDRRLDMGVEYDAQKQAYIDHTAGSVILIKSTNTDIRLTSSELIADAGGTGALIHTVYNNDTMFMNAVPDGAQYPGVRVSMADMDAAGDILHEDYQRDMYLTLDGASLTGAIRAYDCAHWIETAETEGFSDYALDAAYETAHGVYLTLADGGAWTVTGRSNLSGLTIGEGCEIVGRMTVNGVSTPIAPGTYAGQIVLMP